MVLDQMIRNKPGKFWLNSKCECGPQTALPPCVFKNTLFNEINYFISSLFGRQNPDVQSSRSK